MDNRVQLTEGDPPDLANVSMSSSFTWPPNTCDMFLPHHSAFFFFAQWVLVAFCVRNLEEGRAMKVRQTWSLFVFDVRAVLGCTLFRSKIANCPFGESEIPKIGPSKSFLVLFGKFKPRELRVEIEFRKGWIIISTIWGNGATRLQGGEGTLQNFAKRKQHFQKSVQTHGVNSWLKAHNYFWAFETWNCSTLNYLECRFLVFLHSLPVVDQSGSGRDHQNQLLMLLSPCPFCY